MRVGESYCPGILHAVPAKDGLLIRIRVPGGLIGSSQLSAIAAASTAFADGQVEITSRANIQLRAIKRQNLAHVVHALTFAGTLPSLQHDRVRNIVSSPLAGLDVEEIVDTRPFVRDLDNALMAKAELAGLPPKFTFAVDGGGRRFSLTSDDLALRAVNISNKSCFYLLVGGACSGFSVTEDNAVECLIEAAAMCLRISKEFNVPARGKQISSIPSAIERLFDGLSHFLMPCSPPVDVDVVVEAPVGIDLTSYADLVSVIPAVPLGRLTAEQAQRISHLAREWGDDLRLAPWRGIVVGSVPKTAVNHVLAELESVGLSHDGRDGYWGISACAGSVGCEASLADVRRDAAALAHRLQGQDARSGWTVNISGCEKRCAMRNGATVELVAGPSGYNLKMDGRFIASDYSPDIAINAVVGRHSAMAIEVS